MQLKRICFTLVLHLVDNLEIKCILNAFEILPQILLVWDQFFNVF